jgi:hypothetical protein
VQLADVLDGIRVAQVSLEDCPVSLVRYALAADLGEQVNRQVHDMVRHAATGLESIFSNLKGACSHELAQHLASGRKDTRTITRLAVPELPRLQRADVDRWHRDCHVRHLPPLPPLAVHQATVNPARGTADRSLDATPRA